MPRGMYITNDGTAIQDPDDVTVQATGAVPFMAAEDPGVPVEQLAPQASLQGQPEQGQPIASGPPDTTGMHPIEAKAQYRRWLNSMGYDVKQDYGQAGREAGYVPMRREGAISDPGFGERQNLADRERSLVRDNRDIEFAENARQQAFIAEEQGKAEQRVLDQEMKLGAIDQAVVSERQDLDNQMAKHREMIAQGLDPWKAFGGGSWSGKVAAALSLSATSMAGGQYAQQGMELFNRMMDREIDSQKYELETQGGQVNNAYGRLRDHLGDRDQAENALRALMLNAAKAQLSGLMSETADIRSQQAANETILQIDKDLLQANDAYHARSIGKISEAYDQGQVARAGRGEHIAPLSLSQWQSNLGSKADVAGKAASTAKTWADLSDASGPGSQDEAFESIPGPIKSKLVGLGEAATSFEQFFNRIGLKADPKTGAVEGKDPEGIPGVGLDAAVPGRVMFSEEAKLNQAALEKAMYDMSRQDVGANFTGGEKMIVDKFQNATFEGQRVALAKQLYKLIVAKKNSAVNMGLSGRQRAAFKDQEAQINKFNTAVSHGWKD